MANLTRTQMAIGGLALASVGVLAYSLVRPTKEQSKKKKTKKKGPKTAKFEYTITKIPMDLHLVMSSEEGFHAHVAGDKKNKKLKFGAKLFKINDKKVENLPYEEIITQLQRVKAPATLIFKECPNLEADWKQAEEFREKGNDYYKKGDTENGIEECSKAIQLHPTNKVYYSNRVLMYLKCNQYELALEDCQKIRELDPLSMYVKGHYLRGLVLFNLNKIKHAAAAFQTVMKLEPSFKQAKVRLDDCLKKLEIEEAKEQEKIVEKRRSSQKQLLQSAKANKNENDDNENDVISSQEQAVAQAKAQGQGQGSVAVSDDQGNKEGENDGSKSIFEDSNANKDENKLDNNVNKDNDNDNSNINNDDNDDNNNNNDGMNDDENNNDNVENNEIENANNDDNKNNEDNKDQSMDDNENVNSNNNENENDNSNNKEMEAVKSIEETYEKVDDAQVDDQDGDAQDAVPSAAPVANENEAE